MTSDLPSLIDQTTFHTQIRDLRTCHIVYAVTLYELNSSGTDPLNWAIQLLGQTVAKIDCFPTRPHLLALSVTLSIEDVRRWNDDQWREVYTAVAARGRVHTPSIYVSVQPPTHWVCSQDISHGYQPPGNWTEGLLLLVRVSSCCRSLDKGKVSWWNMPCISIRKQEVFVQKWCL